MWTFAGSYCSKSGWLRKGQNKATMPLLHSEGLAWIPVPLFGVGAPKLELSMDINWEPLAKLLISCAVGLAIGYAFGRLARMNREQNGE